MELYAASGPLFEPANRSGVHGGFGRRCTCDPSIGQDCDRCNGVAEDEWAVTREARNTRPTGRPLSDAEVMRIVEACRPTTHNAEEATA